MESLKQHFHFNKKIELENFVAHLLLLFSLLIGYKTLLWGEFGDEGVILATGNLISKGLQLYKDIFSHHFPFPYYWSSLIVSLFGKSLTLQRLCLLILQLLILYIAMILSKEYLLVGSISIMWSIFRLFYKGNMLVYSSLSGIALLGILIIVIPIFQRKIRPRYIHWLTIGLLASLALGSDPLSIYPIGVTLFFLSIKRIDWGIKTSAGLFTIIFLYSLYLYLNNNFMNFWENTIVFNRTIYSKYTYTNPLRLDLLFSYTLNGLEIFNRNWFNFDLFRKISLEFMEFDKWFFTGFLYRFAIICATIELIITKKYLAAAYLYLYAASTLSINKWDFRAQPFILTALYAISAQIPPFYISKEATKKSLLNFLRILIIVITLWSMSRITSYVIASPGLFSKKVFIPYQTSTKKILTNICDQQDVYLAHYPVGGYYYWYSDLRPVSKYVYMWPWVAEVGINDVLNTLKERNIKAIVIIQPITVWGKYPTHEYLQPILKYLNVRYIKIDSETYISPKLFQICNHSNP